MRTVLKKYTMNISNRVFYVILVLALVYVLAMFKISVTPAVTPTVHSNDSHRNLHITDEIIVILGYKLHPDGMPQRTLRDRVEKAAELYKSLMSKGHHPLVIVSGKGKKEIGYTEADVMEELAMWFGVRQEDILVDSESTNTAQNAKFSAALIKDNEAIVEVFVVTSDYHTPRAQYIFQTVFPSNIQLEFVSSISTPQKIADEIQRERSLLKSSQDDLQAEGYLEDEVYGYHPMRNFPRWQMIDREFENDLRTGVIVTVGPKATPITVVDYGSNYGYFSLHVAEKFPKATVVSLEGEAYKEYNGAATFHGNKMKEQEIRNNYLCRTTVTPETFSKLFDANAIYTYQLCLSVFHWFKPMQTREKFESALGHLLLNARTTFLELPEAMNYKGNEAQHNWDYVNTWYAGRNETQILEDIAETFGFNLRYKYLGPILHDNNTVRKVLRVDVIGQSPHISVSEALEIYDCKALMGGPSV